MILIDHTFYDKKREFEEKYYISKYYLSTDRFGKSNYFRGWIFYNKYGIGRPFEASFHPEIQEGNEVYYKGNEKVFTLIKN
jgi:hypothetical protein